jgi:transposase-like protein
MTLADLLKERLDVENQDSWENERTPTPVRCFALRLHSMGLSLREVEAVLDWLGVDRYHQAIWYWKETAVESQSDPPTAAPSRVAVDEKQIEGDGEKKWLYAAIDTESKLLLDVDVFSRRGTDPAAAFLHRLSKQHDVANAGFLVDAGGYLTALSRHDLRGHLDYEDWNHIENGSRPSPCEPIASTPFRGAVRQARNAG